MHQLLQPRPSAAAATTVVAGVTAVVSVALLASVLVDVRHMAVVVALSIAGVASAVDHAVGRIPDRLVLGALVPLGVVPVVSGDRGLAVGMLLGAVLLSGPLLVVHIASPTAMGFGDVKLAVPLGAAVGTFDARAALLALGVASLGGALLGLLRRQSTVRFGPALVAGAAFAVVIVVAAGGISWR
ncbi:MAG: prepilin peptidase [Ilumatobacter sp.]|nr:prepilin peptidase [Ilumatobacter sp.]